MKNGYYIGTDGLRPIDKDPTAVLDYPFDWIEWLNTAETISSTSVTVSINPLTVESNAVNATSKAVIVWLSGGVVGTSYRVSVTITTSEQRTDTRSINVNIINR